MMKLSKTAVRNALTTTTLAMLAFGAGQAMAGPWEGAPKPGLSAQAIQALADQYASQKTICGQGKITNLERTWGPDNVVRLSTESQSAPYDAYKNVPGLGSMTEVSFGATATDRDKDRISLLQLAMANKLAVQIVSSGASCKAASDTFDITLCTDANACAQPR